MANDPGPAPRAEHVCSCPDTEFEVVRPWVHFSYILKAMTSLLRDPRGIKPEKTSHKKLLYRSLRDHMERSKKWPGLVRTRGETAYLPMVPMCEDDSLPAVDVVIVTHNSKRHVRSCLESVLACAYPPERIRVIVLDNGSEDRTLDILGDLERANGRLRVVRRARNVGFGAGVSRALETTAADYVLVLRPSAALRPECLERLVAAALSTEEHGYAIWEARQYPSECPKTYDPVTLETEWICGACFLVGTDVFRKLKGFDEDMFLSCADVDLSWRTRMAGLKLMYVPSAVVVCRAGEHPVRSRRRRFRHTMLSGGPSRHRIGGLRGILWSCWRHFRLLMKRAGPERALREMPSGSVELVPRPPEAPARTSRAAKEGLSQLSPGSGGLASAIRREGACYAMKGSRATPLVSIIIRTKDRPYYLREALQSVRHQTYPNIEVIVVEDRASSAEDVVAEFPDLNCTYLKLGEPGGRCRAGNAGLQRATGKYVNFLDEDDLFYADHVEVMVGELESTESRLAAYSIAFVVKTDVVSTRPFVYRETEYAKFGREYSREALLSRNYIPIHCMMFNRGLYLREGGFDESMDVLEDWDLWLRYSRCTDFLFVEKTTCLFRVPHDPRRAADRLRVLRAAEDRVRNKHALGEGTGPGVQAGERGRPQPPEWRGRRARADRPAVEATSGRSVSERGEVCPAGDRECSIIIPVHNCAELTRWCLEAIRKNTSSGVDYEVVVVDNGSTDSTGELLARLKPPFRFVRHTENLAFARGCNAGAKAARGKYLVFLNNDTVPLPGWLSAMRDCARRHPHAGIVGSKLLYPGHDLIQHAGLVFAEDGLPYHIHRMLPSSIPEANVEREYDAVTGACLLVRNGLFAELGGFDPAFVNGHEDVDLCLRARERRREVVYCPHSVLYHHEGTTAGRHDHEERNVSLFRSRWAGRTTSGIHACRAALARAGDPLLKTDATGTRFAAFVGRTFIKCDRDPVTVRYYAGGLAHRLAVICYKLRYFLHRGAVRRFVDGMCSSGPAAG